MIDAVFNKSFSRREVISAGLALAAAACSDVILFNAPQQAFAAIPTSDELTLAQDDATNLISQLNLPALDRMNETDTATYIAPLKVVQRASTLGLNQDIILHPEQSWKTLYSQIIAIESQTQSDNTIEFSGTTASELNEVIAASSGGQIINITSPQIEIDTIIELADNITLVGNQTAIVPVGGATPIDYSLFGTDNDPSVGEVDPLGIAFEIADCTGVAIKGFTIDAEQFAIYAHNCANLTIEGNTIQDIRRRPIVIVGGHDIRIRSNTIQTNVFGGIYIFGNVENLLIEDNTVTASINNLNVHAALVLMTARNENEYSLVETTDQLYRNAKTIDQRTDSPHNVIVYGNNLSGNRGASIYDDGAYLTYFVNNQIDGNDKEGMCLDFGTVATYIGGNTITNNGFRATQSDDELRVDAVDSWGRLEDGSSAAKLPGLSLDNAMWAIIDGNTVSTNAGSGIKAVRTAVQCLITRNTITDNNAGQNDSFHGFGVELGTATVNGDNSKYLNAEMDSTPDYENIVAHNTITGAHWDGVYIAEDCFINDITANQISGAEYTAVESVSQLHNDVYDNITDLPIDVM